MKAVSPVENSELILNTVKLGSRSLGVALFPEELAWLARAMHEVLLDGEKFKMAGATALSTALNSAMLEEDRHRRARGLSDVGKAGLLKSAEMLPKGAFSGSAAQQFYKGLAATAFRMAAAAVPTTDAQPLLLEGSDNAGDLVIDVDEIRRLTRLLEQRKELTAKPWLARMADRIEELSAVTWWARASLLTACDGQMDEVWLPSPVGGRSEN